MWGAIAQLLLGFVKLVDQHITQKRKEQKHEEAIFEIKASPRAAMRAKFGRVRDDVSTNTEKVLPGAGDGHEGKPGGDNVG